MACAHQNVVTAAGHWPHVGDLAVCFKCEAILQYVNRSGLTKEVTMADLGDEDRQLVEAYKAMMHKLKSDHNL